MGNWSTWKKPKQTLGRQLLNAGPFSVMLTTISSCYHILYVCASSDLSPDSQFLSKLSCWLNFNLKQRGDLLPCTTSSSTTGRRGAHGRRGHIGVCGASLVGSCFRARERGTSTGVRCRDRSGSWGTFVGHGPLVGHRGNAKVTAHWPTEIPGAGVGVWGAESRRRGEEANSWRGFGQRVDPLLLQLLHLLLVFCAGLGILRQHLD